MKHGQKPVDNQKNKNCPSEERKRAKYFQESRDIWKKRVSEKRKQLQVAMTKVNRLSEREKKLKENAEILKEELSKSKIQLLTYAEKVKLKDLEIDELKKNSSDNSTGS
jgi:pyruvate-formate lyase-activating enzyme